MNIYTRLCKILNELQCVWRLCLYVLLRNLLFSSALLISASYISLIIIINSDFLCWWYGFQAALHKQLQHSSLYETTISISRGCFEREKYSGQVSMHSLSRVGFCACHPHLTGAENLQSTWPLSNHSAFGEGGVYFFSHPCADIKVN